MSIMLGLAIYFALLMITVPLLLCFLSIGHNDVEDELCFYEFLHDVSHTKQLDTNHLQYLKAFVTDQNAHRYVRRT